MERRGLHKAAFKLMIALLYVKRCSVQHMCIAEDERQILGWNAVVLLLI